MAQSSKPGSRRTAAQDRSQEKQSTEGPASRATSLKTSVAKGVASQKKKPKKKGSGGSPSRQPTPSAESLRLGQKKELEAVAKLRLQTTPLRPASGGFATSAAGLAGGPVFQHFLPVNRFDWWQAGVEGRVPASGPVVPSLRDNIEPVNEFRTEFFSPLATVAGARLDELDPQQLKAKKLPWEGNENVNTLPGAEFVIRPGGGLTTIELREAGNQVVLTAVTAPANFGPDATPVTSLTIDFFVPQRAVGLEAGYLSNLERSLGGEFFELVARDADGNEIPRALSTGEALHGNALWDPGRVYYIGVKDQEGGIRSVELRFTEQGAFTVEDTLFVQRIWYESFPACAVYQGTLCRDEATWGRFQHPKHPDITDGVYLPGFDSRVHASPARFDLPFRCRKAAVFMRGFKLAREAEEAVDVQRLAAGIFMEQPNTGEVVLKLAASFEREVSRDGGAFVGGVYFTLLAWDPDQIDLAVSSDVGSRWHGPGFAYVTETAHQHPEVASERISSPEERFGQLFQGMSWFQFLFRRPVELQTLSWAPGERNGNWVGESDEEASSNWEDAIEAGLFVGATFFTGIGGLFFRPGSTTPVSIDNPPLGYTQGGRKLSWGWGVNVGSTVDGDEELGTACNVVVLSGHGLRLPVIDPLALSVEPRVQRRLGDDAFIEGDPLGLQVEAEMALVVLGRTLFLPQDQIRELDVEVRGKTFDGVLLEMNVGGGIDLRPSTDDARLVIGEPRVAVFLRKMRAPVHGLLTQGLAFAFMPGFISMAPEQPGALRNRGNVPAVITSAALEGLPDEERDALALRLDYRGEIFSLEEIASRGPLVLFPGETLVVTGRFYTANAERWSTRVVNVRFETRVPGRERVLIPVVTRLTAEDATGELLPATINFGLVPLAFGGGRPQAPRIRYALLVSSGSTPLLVRSIALSAAVASLTVGVTGDNAPPGAPPPAIAPGVLYQVDPGASLRLTIAFWPDGPGRFDTTLEVETNDGRFSARVVGEAVNP